MRQMTLLCAVAIMILRSVSAGAQSQIPYLEVVYGAQTYTFYPSDDSQISQHEPGGIAGSLPHMETRNYAGGGGVYNWETDLLVKFEINIPTLRAITSITSATLNLFYYQSADNNPAGNSLDLFRVTSSWDESSLTWYARPTRMTLKTDTATVPGSAGVWMQWDVTSDVQSYFAGTHRDHGWQLIDTTYFGNYDIPRTQFRTKELACGNGAIEFTEACDDGGTASGDGCSASCQVESGYVCVGEPSVCTPDACGSGTIAAGEECDDGGTASGDGCSASCQVESGYICVGEPSLCTVDACGSGAIAAGEECDDGDTTPGDGCDGSCQIESGWHCLWEPSVCSTCGDEAILGPEGCDDGDTTPGDGCDASCQIEWGWDCSGEPSLCSENCGDGIIVGSEECDDGDTTPGDGCDASCQIESGWICLGEPSVCSVCGNGAIAGLEQCDDGGTTPGDGCGASCQIESGWDCSGEPSVCSEVCGDGIILGSEECDDGGTTPGDGCDASCQIELGWTCVGEPSVCTSASAVPALSTWMQLALVIGLLGIGVAVRRWRLA